MGVAWSQVPWKRKNGTWKARPREGRSTFSTAYWYVHLQIAFARERRAEGPIIGRAGHSGRIEGRSFALKPDASNRTSQRTLTCGRSEVRFLTGDDLPASAAPNEHVREPRMPDDIRARRRS